MCGKIDKLYKTIVEGAELEVCTNCSKHGKVLGTKEELKKRLEPLKKTVRKQSQTILLVKPEYASIIRNTRERLGLKQEQLAKKLAEKLSVIQKLENGQLSPSIALSQKLERILNLKLIEEHNEDDFKMVSSKETIKNPTFADFVKVRKR
ncbi:TIGR00270 family protein [Candidatus Woesearchaeota archaeon]|nr:TIGR00270 family protein [Candidatus Woesearchaeota archaeon]